MKKMNHILNKKFVSYAKKIYFFDVDNSSEDMFIT